MKRTIGIAAIVLMTSTNYVQPVFCQENAEQKLYDLNEKANVAIEKGNYKDGLKSAEEAYEYAKKQLGEENPTTVKMMNNLAVLYQSLSDYKKAEQLLEQAFQLNRSILGPEAPDTITSINNLASLYYAQGRYSEAEPLLKLAFELNKKVLGAEHQQTLNSINNLGELYVSQGRYSEAEQLLSIAFVFKEKVLGTKDPSTLKSANNLAGLYYLTGQYSKAEPIYKAVLKLKEKEPGKKGPETLAVKNNLAILYDTQGRYREAESLVNECLAVSKEVNGEEHEDTINYTNSLAGLYNKQKRYSEAEKMYKQALQLSEKVLGKEHRNTLTLINNLAHCYKEQGRYSEAEMLYKQALQLREKVRGKEHPDTLHSINNLAALYYDAGNYLEAEPLYSQGLQLSEKILGSNHPFTIGMQENYIYLLASTNRYTAALTTMEDMEHHLFPRSFQELYASSSEKVRRMYLGSIISFQQMALSLAKQQTDEQYQRFAAEVILRWKQVYAEESAVQHRLLTLNDDAESAKIQAQINASQAKLSQALRPTEEKQNISELIEKANQDETALLALARHLRTGLEVEDVTLERVLAALPQDSGLIEYRLFMPVDFKTAKPGELHLAALLLLADPNAKQRFMFRDLGPVADTVNWLKEDGTKNAEAYKWLLGPFDEQIKNLKQLYIAPDGPLSLLSFASLRLPDGRFLAERQQINNLQTGRDLLENGKDFPRGKGLVAIGGAKYGSMPTGAAEQAPTLAAAYQQRAARELAQGIAYLPESRREAQAVKGIFTSKKTGEQLELLIGDDASEYNLKHLKQPPRILHLSTHGFYLAQDEKSPVAEEAPLLLSGLALAGANNGLQGRVDAHGDDGLLYSLEVLGLNLHGTELVSLSACETGKGVLDYSEGVYGLVRAFRTAGAKFVLMTLTPVGDKASREFMTTFYDKWLSSETSINPAEALHQTRLQFIHDKKPVKDWAPFVLVGK